MAYKVLCHPPLNSESPMTVAHGPGPGSCREGPGALLLMSHVWAFLNLLVSLFCPKEGIGLGSLQPAAAAHQARPLVLGTSFDFSLAALGPVDGDGLSLTLLPARC